MSKLLPKNAHVSTHPCLLAKLSKLRCKDTSAKEVKSLVHDISLIVGCEALASSVSATPGPKVVPPSPARRAGAPANTRRS